MGHKEKKTVQQTLFGETANIIEEEDEEFEEIIIDDFKGEHKCPMCGFEWND